MLIGNILVLAGVILDSRIRESSMGQRDQNSLAALIGKHEQTLREQWMAALRSAGALRTGQLTEAELAEQTQTFMREFKAGIASDPDSVEGESWALMRQFLGELSRSRALQGYSPSETATFVFSLKEPLFTLIRREFIRDPDGMGEVIWAATQIVDKLGLYTTELHQQGREEVIARQGRELLELSTPVVSLWSKILALPLIGTLDSERTQIVMEQLLHSIVELGAEIAIIDISGVPTVDTLVAQHLVKTISAARLMGADCIISGIRPQIAQTIVHLGLDLNVVSKATMADAFALALRRTGQTVNAAAASQRA